MDTTKRLINVTAQDIANGVRKSTDHCPIALAAIRRCGFSPNEVCVMGEGNLDTYFAWTYAARKKVDSFIKRFDAGKPVKPFKFYAQRSS